jgi:hypothetical protein
MRTRRKSKVPMDIRRTACRSPEPTVGWSGCPPIHNRRGHTNASEQSLLGTIFPKDVQSNNPFYRASALVLAAKSQGFRKTTLDQTTSSILNKQPYNPYCSIRSQNNMNCVIPFFVGLWDFSG